MFGNTDVPFVRPVQIPSPAAGADFTVTAPGQGIWRVVGLTAVLTTSAAVANRIPSLVINGSDGRLAQLVGTASLAASLAATWGTFPGAVAVAGAVSLHQWPMPTDGVVLLPGFSLASLTAAIDAADQWSLIRALVVEYPTGPTWRTTPDVPTFIEPKA